MNGCLGFQVVVTFQNTAIFHWTMMGKEYVSTHVFPKKKRKRMSHPENLGSCRFYPLPRMPVTKEGLGRDSLLKMESSWWWLLLHGGVVPRDHFYKYLNPTINFLGETICWLVFSGESKPISISSLENVWKTPKSLTKRPCLQFKTTEKKPLTREISPAFFFIQDDNSKMLLI